LPVSFPVQIIYRIVSYRIGDPVGTLRDNSLVTDFHRRQALNRITGSQSLWYYDDSYTSLVSVVLRSVYVGWSGRVF